MYNMLYIIAGLVVILLVAVLVMRKNKAQKPSKPLSTNTGKIEPLSKHAASRSTPTQTAINHEKKFDHIEIAQRFMDQQRYDKAIETLNRGLSEKPNDSQLSLKLLAVYATIDESENFNKVYDAIKANNDKKSIAQADQLKALLTEEQTQVAKQTMLADKSEDNGFESLDFNLPINKASSNSAVLDTDAAQNIEYKNDSSKATDETVTASKAFDDNGLDDNAFDDDNFDDIEQAFDLSLSDLEDSNNEPVPTTDANSAPVTKLDLVDENILTPTTMVIDTDNNSHSTDNDSDSDSDSDFDFDFELSEQSLTSTESPVNSATHDSVNSGLNELSLEDEFVLDLDGDANTNNVISNAPVTTETPYLDDDRLTLSLDNVDILDETQNNTAIQHSIVEDNFDDFSFEDISIEDANIENISVEETDIVKNDSEASSIAPTTMMFDDDTVIDDDFDFDSLSESNTASTPVEIDSEYANIHIDDAIDIAADTDSAEDFSSRFAADFDFVKSLDSNQVTLDLAGQYVQLGEYDSAKRLLNEVIAKGNSEQQQQAQLLLDRTA